MTPPRYPQPAQDHPYQLVSQVDVTAEALLPEQAAHMVSTLRELEANPAHALISIADEAGVPAVGDLYSVLPGPLKDRLEGWINDEIAKVRIGGLPVTAYAGQVAALADTVLTHVTLDSELTFHGASARHRLTALDLTPTGVALRLPIGGLVGDVLTQDTSCVIAKSGALTLGEQHFGLNYGEYAWQGIEAVASARFGTSIRAALGDAIHCPGIAHAVAARCVSVGLFDVCVGHEAELTSICEGGLDAIVDFAHDRIADMRLEALHLASGQATLVDPDRDGVADRITGGSWQAEINLGLGLRHAPASFTGTR